MHKLPLDSNSYLGPVAGLRTALADRYRLEHELGQGGMATVYLAHDLRHDRKVAVKVLRPEVAAVLGAERFVVEIKTTASLQHPNILALFDSGTSEGFLYYVMPYVEGESLRDRLSREVQLDVEAAVSIATEVAGALDYAHRHGVIHRDIKPENILLHDGRAIVADFGIALAVSAAAGGRITETGLSLGTPHYMSPEQAAADKHLTNRTDIYSLGTVLYEMLTGSPPHVGASPQQIISRIVTEDAAPVTAIRGAVPPNVSAAVARALERVPADRFPTAKAFADALVDPTFRTPRRNVERPARRWAAWPIAAAALGSLAIGVSLGRALVRPAPARTERFAVALPDSASLVAAAGVNVAWTPDGSRLIYVGPSRAGEGQLWLRSIDGLGIAPIAGTEAARIPAVSPNDSAVAFTSGDALKIVPLYGGPPATLVPDGVPSVGGGLSWSEDGYIYFVDNAGAIRRIAPNGKASSLVVAADTSGSGYMWIDALPGNAGILFTVARVGIPEASEIAVAPASGAPVRRLFRGTMARYARSGHVLFTTADGTLMAVPFDLRRLEPTGTPVAVEQGVDIYMASASQFALSRAGDLAFVSGQAAERQVVQVDRTGAGSPIDPSWTGNFLFLTLSPNGGRLAVTTGGASGSQVWIKPLSGDPAEPVRLTGTRNTAVGWSPDGRSLAVVSNRSAPGELWLAPVDRVDAAQRVPLTGSVYNATWFPDGSELIAASATAGHASQIVGFRAGRDTATRTLAAGSFLMEFPDVSPDGRLLAYSSNESGHDEVYVQRVARGAEGKWLVSTGGGLEPIWSHSGRELFYRSVSGVMMVVDVDATGTFRSGPPRALFPIGPAVDGRLFAPTLDDRHFLLVRPLGRSGSEIRVVEHFDAELRRKLGR